MPPQKPPIPLVSAHVAEYEPACESCGWVDEKLAQDNFMRTGKRTVTAAAMSLRGPILCDTCRPVLNSVIRMYAELASSSDTVVEA